MSKEYSPQPAILGKSLYTNPLLAADGRIQSAFVDTQLDPTGAEIRIRESLWGGQGEVPSDAETIAADILLLAIRIDKNPPKAAARMGRHIDRLAGAYSDLGGSAVLLYATLLPEISEVPSEPDVAENEAKQALMAMKRFAGLHTPLDEQEQTEKLKAEVLPLISDKFQSLYDFVGGFTLLRAGLPGMLVRRDEAYMPKLGKLLEVYSEHLDSYEPSQLADWLVTDGLLAYHRDIYPELYQGTGERLKEKELKQRDTAVLGIASLPVLSYFMVSSGQGEGSRLELDFDKVRSFIEYSCSQDAESVEASHYKAMAILVAALVLRRHEENLKRDKRDVQEFFIDRADKMRAVGLPPEADSMIFTYGFCANELD